MIAGIDFSLNATSITIRRETDYMFHVFKRGSENVKFFEILSSVGVKVHEVPSFASTKDYSENEALKLEDATHLVTIVKEILESYNINKVSLEGLSYGSKGSRTLDIAGYAYLARYTISSVVGGSNLIIASPSNIKKIASGKGTSDKSVMISSFIENKIEDQLLLNTPLWKSMVENIDLYKTKGGTWRKPIDDLIDSYFCLKILDIKK